MSKKVNIFSRFLKWIKGVFSGKREVKISKNNNKGKRTNSPQINAGDESSITINDNRTYNIYNSPPNKGTITSPNAAIKNEKKNQKQELVKEENTIEQNQPESKEKSTKKIKRCPNKNLKDYL